MENGEPTRIMIAVNKSSIEGYLASISSKGAFDWTLQNIVKSNISGFKLLFLHVLAHGDEDGFDGIDRTYASPDDFKSTNFRNKARGIHLLEYFVNRCHEIGMNCDAWTKRGDPRIVICYEVSRVRPDLLVVGSRGLGRVNRVFFRNISEYCQDHAECPVIRIKRRADETPQDPLDD